MSFSFIHKHKGLKGCPYSEVHQGTLYGIIVWAINADLIYTKFSYKDVKEMCQVHIKTKSFNIQSQDYEVDTHFIILSLKALMSKIYGNELAMNTTLLFKNETFLC